MRAEARFDLHGSKSGPSPRGDSRFASMGRRIARSTSKRWPSLDGRRKGQDCRSELENRRGETVIDGWAPRWVRSTATRWSKGEMRTGATSRIRRTSCGGTPRVRSPRSSGRSPTTLSQPRAMRSCSPRKCPSRWPPGREMPPGRRWRSSRPWPPSSTLRRLSLPPRARGARALGGAWRARDRAAAPGVEGLV